MEPKCGLPQIIGPVLGEQVINPTTKFTYSLPEAAHVNIQIYNILGERVATLINGQMNAGSHVVRWNARNAATGVYFYRIRAGDYHAVRKMILLK